MEALAAIAKSPDVAIVVSATSMTNTDVDSVLHEAREWIYHQPYLVYIRTTLFRIWRKYGADRCFPAE